MAQDSDGFDSDTRRSFVKKGALATGAAALGMTGSVAAQDDDVLDDVGGDALILDDNFRPDGQFVFVSGVIEWVPEVPDVRDSLWENYNTYQIRWLGTNEIVPLWVSQDADVGEYDEDLGYVADLDDDPEEPQAWEMSDEWAPLSDNEILLDVNFSPVDEDEEDDLLEDDEWWGDDD